jgi:hypothetical protein
MGTMFSEKKHSDECYDCKGSLELFEMDMQKGTKIMKCKICGLYHFYKKDFLANWKLTKVSKELHPTMDVDRA